MNEYNERSFIGEIEFLDPINERQVDTNDNFKARGLGKCKVEVYDNEGQIPHFHIIGANIDCCIQIYSSEYFVHGMHDGKLTNGQAKQLDKWLRKDNKAFKNSGIKASNWIAICISWKLSNPGCRFPKSKILSEQPDYSKLNET